MPLSLTLNCAEPLPASIWICSAIASGAPVTLPADGSNGTRINEPVLVA